MLLTDLDIEYTYDKDKPSLPLVWVLDGQCVYDIPTPLAYAQIFLSVDEVVDISADYPEHEGTVVRLIKDGEPKMELSTSEYFGSILLSNPLVLDLKEYAYGAYVDSPHAQFDGEKFIITNRDMETLDPWPTYTGCCNDENLDS